MHSVKKRERWEVRKGGKERGRKEGRKKERGKEGRREGQKSRRSRKGRGHTSAYAIARGINRSEEVIRDSNDQVNMIKINI